MTHDHDDHDDQSTNPYIEAYIKLVTALTRRELTELDYHHNIFQVLPATTDEDTGEHLPARVQVVIEVRSPEVISSALGAREMGELLPTLWYLRESLNHLIAGHIDNLHASIEPGEVNTIASGTIH